MSPTMVEDHAIVDVLGRAQNVVTHGRDTLNVIEASIVQEMTASEQHTKAVEMHSKSGLNLPAVRLLLRSRR